MSAQLAIPDSTRLVPGSIVGNKYRIDGCLGEGGMGVVLSATHLELDAPVAIKVVREEYAGSADIVARVLFEARAVARMRSSHVVRVLDVARLDSGCPYIVMEQLQGVDLGQALWDHGAFSVPQAIDYVLQACDGLAEAHSLGIVHRDLKPGNLFLAATPEGVVLKVLDFGISKEVSTPLRSISRTSRTSLTSAGDPVGSPYYMAPEQMRASPDIDARADIWSLGAILFELTAGQTPFEGDTITEVCTKVLTEDPPSLAQVSNGAVTELDQVIARCLEKDPERRYQSVSDFAAALRAWRPSEDVELPEPEPKTRKLRSARLPLAMIGLSALLTLGAVGFWQTHGSAASLEASGIRPMIAAAAAPVWRSLRQAPRVEPESPALSMSLRRKSSPRTDTFQSSFMKPALTTTRTPEVSPATSTKQLSAITAKELSAISTKELSGTSTELVPAASSEVAPTTALDAGDPVLPDPVPSASTATSAVEGDTVDAVSHRYGL